MKLELVEDLYAQELAEALLAEKKTLQIMPRFLQAARSEDLKFLIERHTRETEQQVKDLEKIVQKFDASPEKKGMVITALLNEMETTLKMQAEPDLLEAAIIFGAQKIEHNEIACYAGLQTMAKLLSLEQDAQILERILQQEKKMSEGLFAMAEEVEMEALESEEAE
jgi:ferritin-like metal-binding protein YciE